MVRVCSRSRWLSLAGTRPSELKKTNPTTAECGTIRPRSSSEVPGLGFVPHRHPLLGTRRLRARGSLDVAEAGVWRPAGQKAAGCEMTLQAKLLGLLTDVPWGGRGVVGRRPRSRSGQRLI
jgi:hypothetical protein